jgi:hypothetical protein
MINIYDPELWNVYFYNIHYSLNFSLIFKWCFTFVFYEENCHTANYYAVSGK